MASLGFDVPPLAGADAVTNAVDPAWLTDFSTMWAEFFDDPGALSADFSTMLADLFNPANWLYAAEHGSSDPQRTAGTRRAIPDLSTASGIHG
jgi:hypothetical protein